MDLERTATSAQAAQRLSRFRDQESDIDTPQHFDRWDYPQGWIELKKIAGHIVFTTMFVSPTVSISLPFLAILLVFYSTILLSLMHSLGLDSRSYDITLQRQSFERPRASSLARTLFAVLCVNPVNDLSQ